jgi:hypothetical protein
LALGIISCSLWKAPLAETDFRISESK